MFSFHKPKIYRSNLGCCICKAKSSSSRFTDSQKYENEFERCFRIQEKRSGEICNACVLLVKRWKKLSPENRQLKHWNHVVDARAGPGTKLTGNRRLTAANAHSNFASSNTGHHDVQPLSSNQSSNQRESSHSQGSSSNYQQQSGATSSTSGSTSKRTSSFSKALAIDTNVSTFTFGEPANKSHAYGRSVRNEYATNYTHYASQYSSCASTSTYGPSKPQSALNSSAFESVLKRFRQRQQQQKLKQQKRNQKAAAKTPKPKSSPAGPAETSAPTRISNKRQKRCSESSIVIDGFRISAILDSGFWRRERVCCGQIFRGLHNEIAIFPKLITPCELARKATTCSYLETIAQGGAVSSSEVYEEPEARSPPPRATKSGSISSCDSNTSGTGSMEASNFEEAAAIASLGALRGSQQATRAQRHSTALEASTDAPSEQVKRRPVGRPAQGAGKRSNAIPAARGRPVGRRRQPDGLIPTDSSPTHSASSSSNSSSIAPGGSDKISSLVQSDSAEDEEEEEPMQGAIVLVSQADEDELDGHALVMSLDDDEDDEDDVGDDDDTNTDASTSVESLAGHSSAALA